MTVSPLTRTPEGSLLDRCRRLVLNHAILSTIDKLAIYAGIGVPEVWRFDGATVSIFRDPNRNLPRRVLECDSEAWRETGEVKWL